MPLKGKPSGIKSADKTAEYTAAKTPDKEEISENDSDKQTIQELQDQLKKLQQEMKLLRQEVDIQKHKELTQKAGIEINDFRNSQLEVRGKHDSTKDLPARLEVSGKRLKEEKQKPEADLKAKDEEIKLEEQSGIETELSLTKEKYETLKTEKEKKYKGINNDRQGKDEEIKKLKEEHQKELKDKDGELQRLNKELGMRRQESEK